MLTLLFPFASFFRFSLGLFRGLPSHPRLGIGPNVTCLFLLILSLAHPSIVQADFVILGNLAGAIDDFGQTVLDPTGGFSIGFTVGNEPLLLTSIDLRLKTMVGNGTASLYLRENPVSTGQLLSTLSLDTNIVTGHFLVNQPPTLTANKSYWLTLGADTALGISLRQIIVPPSSGNPGASFDGLRTGTFENQIIPLNPSDFTPTFQINGIQAVPEPSSFALLSLIGLGAGLRCRFRRRLKKQ